MTRDMAGHRVRIEQVDGMRYHWRVSADGAPLGLVVQDGVSWRTLPVRGLGPECFCPSQLSAVFTLVVEAGV